MPKFITPLIPPPKKKINLTLNLLPPPPQQKTNRTIILETYYFIPVELTFAYKKCFTPSKLFY